MATYVNLNVNQGLINKAKAIQAQNRKTLGEKQSAQAKKKPAAVQDPGKKFGTEYQRRRIGAASGETFAVSSLQIRSILPYQYIRETGSWHPGTREIWSIDQSVSAMDINYGIAATDSFPGRPDEPGGSSAQNFASRDIVLPVGENICIYVSMAKYRYHESRIFPGYLNFREGSLFSSFLVSESAVRLIDTPAGLQELLDYSVTLTVDAPLYRNFLIRRSGDYGWTDGFAMTGDSTPDDPYTKHNYSPDVFQSLLLMIQFPDKRLEFQNLSPDEIALLMTERARVDESGNFCVWQTQDPLDVVSSASNPYVLKRISSLNASDAVADVSNQEHPEKRFIGRKISVPDPQTPGLIRFETPATTYGRTVVNIFFDDYIPIFAGTGLVSWVQDPITYISFYDWGDPGYCRQQLLALGFTEDDLEP